jgi:hypothetical protein
VGHDMAETRNDAGSVESPAFSSSATVPFNGEDYVRWAYRLLLGREPDTLRTVQNHPFKHDRQGLVRAILTSTEFRRNELLALPSLNDQIKLLVEHHVDKYLDGQLPSIVEDILSSRPFHNLTRANIWAPSNIALGAAETPHVYMSASNPITRDFLDPEFTEFCKLYHHPLVIHRKLWEWAYIYHHLTRAGVVKPGMRGLGFGTGEEKLPALFAGMGVQVTATDAGIEEGGWHSEDNARRLDRLYAADIIDRDRFDKSVCFKYCDMKNIPEGLKGYDFIWSSCAFEHLGSLQTGIDFVLNSIESTLKVGGVACHTTEINLSSDLETVDTGKNLLYRKHDIERLCRTLEERGHYVKPLRIIPGDLPPDYFVDVPPYSNNLHLKLLFGGFVTTSLGITARRGR